MHHLFGSCGGAAARSYSELVHRGIERETGVYPFHTLEAEGRDYKGGLNS